MQIELLAKSMTNQNNQQVVVSIDRNDRSMAAIVCYFVRMNPSMFLWLHVCKDTEKIID